MIGKLLASLTRLVLALRSRSMNLYYKALGCEIEGYAWLRSVRIPRQWPDIHLGKGVALDEGVVLLASGEPKRSKIHIEDSVYINRNTFIDASVGIHIGKETMIGPNCYITDHDHQFTAGSAPGAGSLISKPTEIGSKVWLGAGVTVLKGISIGDGAIVGAGSIVTKSIPPDSIAVGNPARVIRSTTD
jgi:carbonic anhydrase/acetyltransferase-like protein (isoleucine patch superfamily)